MRHYSVQYSIGETMMNLYLSSTDQTKEELTNRAIASLNEKFGEQFRIHSIKYIDTKNPEQNESIRRYGENELRINQGYRILESHTVGAAEFVVGYNPNAADPYVCWNCTNETSYDFGHYCSTWNEAYQKMLSRCRTEAVFLQRTYGEQKQNHTPRKNHEQQL